MFLEGKKLSIRDPNYRELRSIFGVDGDYQASDIDRVDHDGSPVVTRQNDAVYKPPKTVTVEAPVTYEVVGYEVEETEEIDDFGRKVLIQHITVGRPVG